MKAPKSKKKSNKNKRRRQNAAVRANHVARNTAAAVAPASPSAASHHAAAPSLRAEPAMRTYAPPPSLSQTHIRTVRSLSIAFAFTALICLWFAQNGINAYWQQTYHRPSPIQNWSNNALWRSGAILHGFLQQYLNSGFTQAALAARSLPEPMPLAEASPNNVPAKPEPPSLPPSLEAAKTSLSNAADHPQVHLQQGDMVLFAGDSMMEGIAPHLQRRLQREHGIDSLNISKQSTGLAYPRMFDWPATIEQHLQQYPRIKVVAVFLGPNDPWDFPNPQGGSVYLKFQSPEWESVYRSRIRRIADAAAAHNARLIWLEIPPMRGSKLQSQMTYLNRIMADELRGRALWLPTAQATGGLPDGRFGENLEHEGRTVRVRSKDGIHFTLKGQQILADHLGSRFIYPNSPP